MVTLLLSACTWMPFDRQDDADDSGRPGTSQDGGGTQDDGGAQGDGGAGSDGGTAEGAPMDPVRALTRISLDLRGVRPSDQELWAVAADPAALGPLTEEFLQDPRFEGRILAMYGELFLTLTDSYEVDAQQLGIDEADEPAFLESVGEEPLRVLASIAANDLPYYELVTADWTMANALLAGIWPLSLAEGEGTWRQAWYTDGRPAAGILSSNAMWWRYGSTRSNANRARANVLSRLLLCNDYLSRPIEFDRDLDLTDEDAVTDALQNDPACVNCHVSLDPLAGYLWGFWWFIDDNPADMSSYHPERELLWEEYSGVAPGYYGEPGGSLADLGQHIAADPRLPACAVEQGFELLLRRESTVQDMDRLTAHREAFLDGGLTIRSLYRSLLTDPAYLAGDGEGTGAVPTKLATPDLLASQVEDLTGYRWRQQGFDMLRTDKSGLRTLAGGADGFFVTRNATGPNATVILVQERLSELAAAWAVSEELRQERSTRRLFTDSELDERADATDEAAVRLQVQTLYRRVLSVELAAEDPRVQDTVQLWTDIAREGGAREAWTSVLTVLLRDPDLLLY